LQKPYSATIRRCSSTADIAAFVANWEDKAANLKTTRHDEHSLDSLVFVDDNPVERAHVRESLPMCGSELPEDVAYYVGCLANAATSKP